MPIKRLHYFDKQFLVEKDFTDEQKYHLEMRRRLNQSLYTSGIAQGLTVDRTGNKEVTVRKGMAIDSEGREIILEADQPVDLSDATKFKPNQEVTITIGYQEEETDDSTSTVPGKTRITEKANAQATPQGSTPPDKSVLLGKFNMDASGNVPATVVIVPGPKIRPAGGLSSINQLGGSQGNITLAAGPGIGIVPNSGTQSIAINALGPASLDGVSNPAGNIDLIQSGAITIAPDNATKRITFGETHSARTDNPHNVTAAQLGALLSSQYDMGRRAFANIVFTNGDANGATRTINIGFLPRLVFVVGACTTSMAGRGYGGGVHAFAVIQADATIQNQAHTSFGVTRSSNTDWFVREFTGFGSIFTATYFNQEVAPAQAENLGVSITSASQTGLTATFSRALTNPTNAQLPSFSIILNLLCFG
jgi:hypothetical protein